MYDRIAAAATDDQLQGELLKYLVPVIYKLNSTEQTVKNTVHNIPRSHIQHYFSIIYANILCETTLKCSMKLIIKLFLF